MRRDQAIIHFNLLLGHLRSNFAVCIAGTHVQAFRLMDPREMMIDEKLSPIRFLKVRDLKGRAGVV